MEVIFLCENHSIHLLLKALQVGSHLSDFLHHSDNCRYLLPCAFALRLPSGQINVSQDGTLTFYEQVGVLFCVNKMAEQDSPAFRDCVAEQRFQ